MAKLTMTKGLPASGKSTWSNEQVLAAPPGHIVRITKDQLRAMLHSGIHSKGTESHIVLARDSLVSTFLKSGVDVIVDDTNLVPFHEQRLREIAKKHQAEFHVQDFCHVPLEECIKRDALRSASVGEEVIRAMHQQHIGDTTPAGQVDQTHTRPEVVLVDIDGTVAIMNGRSPFEWHRVGEDAPNDTVIEIVRALSKNGKRIVFMSGRDGSCREETIKWLSRHVVEGPELYMREADDSRKDSIVKQELYEKYIEPSYDVFVVLDDRNQVVDMWRSLGLICLQVAPGDF